MKPDGYGIRVEGICRCGHRADDHSRNAIGIGACEFWGCEDRAGLDSRGFPHCDRFLNADDTDAFRAEHWAIRNRKQPAATHRDVARLRDALAATASGSDRERYRIIFNGVERQARAA